MYNIVLFDLGGFVYLGCISVYLNNCENIDINFRFILYLLY